LSNINWYHGCQLPDKIQTTCQKGHIMDFILWWKQNTVERHLKTEISIYHIIVSKFLISIHWSFLYNSLCITPSGIFKRHSISTEMYSEKVKPYWHTQLCTFNIFYIFRTLWSVPKKPVSCERQVCIWLVGNPGFCTVCRWKNI
jgi:hypothetical protein